jgi:hypothetical protein
MSTPQSNETHISTIKGVNRKLLETTLIYKINSRKVVNQFQCDGHCKEMAYKAVLQTEASMGYIDISGPRVYAATTNKTGQIISCISGF